MKTSIIVARTLNHVIGKDNTMPWHLPVDLAWFRQNTIGKPKRPNIILSRSGFEAEGAYSASNLAQAMELAKTFANVDEIMIIGGGELFKQALPQADTLYLTEIQANIEGDTFFEFDAENWALQSEQYSDIDMQNPYQCRFMIWKKVD